MIYVLHYKHVCGQECDKKNYEFVKADCLVSSSNWRLKFVDADSSGEDSEKK